MNFFDRQSGRGSNSEKNVYREQVTQFLFSRLFCLFLGGGEGERREEGEVEVWVGGGWGGAGEGERG